MRSAGAAVLVDGGNGVASRLQRWLSWSELDAVVISHLHPDHIADVHCLRFGIFGAQQQGRRQGPLPIYAPTEPVGRLAWIQAPEIPSDFFDLRPLEVQQPPVIGALRFDLAPARHPLPTYAMRITDGQGSLFYSADTSWDDALIDLARDADLGLIEASLLEMHAERRAWGHLTAREAALLAQRAGVKRVLLTHLSPEYDLAHLLAEARQVLPGAELAEEGRVYPVG